MYIVIHIVNHQKKSPVLKLTSTMKGNEKAVARDLLMIEAYPDWASPTEQAIFLSRRPPTFQDHHSFSSS